MSLKQGLGWPAIVQRQGPPQAKKFPDRKPFSRILSSSSSLSLSCSPFYPLRIRRGLVVVTVLRAARLGVSSLCPPSASWASVHLCFVDRLQLGRSHIGSVLGPSCPCRQTSGPRRASSGVWRRDGAHVRTERGGAGGGSAVGGSCPPAWLGLVARRPGVRVRSGGPSLMRVPPRALPGGRPPRPREKKRKGAGVRERDSPDRKAFSPWHVAPPSPSEPARRFSLSFAYLQSRPSCARRSLTGGLCYRKISVPCAFRSCLLWLGDRRCIQTDCLFVQSSCARGRPGHRRETHFPLFLSLGSPLARPDADRPAATARRRIAKLQKIADGHAADSSARHRVAVGDLPTSNVSALRLVLQTLRFTPTPRLKIRTPRKRTSVPVTRAFLAGRQPLLRPPRPSCMPSHGSRPRTTGVGARAPRDVPFIASARGGSAWSGRATRAGRACVRPA